MVVALLAGVVGVGWGFGGFLWGVGVLWVGVWGVVWWIFGATRRVRFLVCCRDL